MKTFEKYFYLIVLFLFSFSFGYGLRMHHESQIIQSQISQAEKEIEELENEFHEAWEEPREFKIFNSQFIVYPIKAVKKTFCYKKQQ